MVYTQTDSVWIHHIGEYGRFYGEVYPSRISLIVNPHPPETKVFDNIEWHSEIIAEGLLADTNILDETFTSFDFSNDYQNAQFTTLIIDSNAIGGIKRRERTWRMAVRGRAERFRDKYLRIDIEYTNDDDRKLILHFLKTVYRISFR